MVGSAPERRVRHAASTAPHFETSSSIMRFWTRSYVPDYIAICFIIIAYILMLIFVTPSHQMFFLDDVALQYPYAAVERVPLGWLFGYALLLPLLLLGLWSLYVRPSAHQVQVTFIAFLVSLLLTSFITDIIKNSVGRPRPDLLARCKPEPGTPEHAPVTYKVCTETNHHVLHDGWRSFPSGHSSFAFCGLGYVSFFFAGQLHLFRSKADISRSLFVLAPLLGAGFIAISRHNDYRHAWTDVIAGSVLGMLVAFFFYRTCYPPLQSVGCEVSYPRRDVTSRNGFSRVKDDEERAGGALTPEPEQDDESETAALTRDSR